ncbi:MAG: hypothetical protein H6737_20020 [Alphaproteobacteria bacterium]|nr:hypothetical protein [Alphaproteobacteria bacterium]
MGSRKSLMQVEDISRELDLVVYRLERPVEECPKTLLDERNRLRRELESLRDRLTDVARDLE